MHVLPVYEKWRILAYYSEDSKMFIFVYSVLWVGVKIYKCSWTSYKVKHKNLRKDSLMVWNVGCEGVMSGWLTLPSEDCQCTEDQYSPGRHTVCFVSSTQVSVLLQLLSFSLQTSTVFIITTTPTQTCYSRLRRRFLWRGLVSTCFTLTDCILNPKNRYQRTACLWFLFITLFVYSIKSNVGLEKKMHLVVLAFMLHLCETADASSCHTSPSGCV